MRKTHGCPPPLAFRGSSTAAASSTLRRYLRRVQRTDKYWFLSRCPKIAAIALLHRAAGDAHDEAIEEQVVEDRERHGCDQRRGQMNSCIVSVKVKMTTVRIPGTDVYLRDT
jgi:hypothetical protein